MADETERPDELYQDPQQLNDTENDTDKDKTGDKTEKDANTAPPKPPTTRFIDWDKRAEKGDGSLRVYWVDKEKCYIFVRAEGVEIKYKYY
jgi:hypothetical protein